MKGTIICTYGHHHYINDIIVHAQLESSQYNDCNIIMGEIRYKTFTTEGTDNSSSCVHCSYRSSDSAAHALSVTSTVNTIEGLA